MNDRYLFRGRRLYNGEWERGNLLQVQRDLYADYFVNGEEVDTTTIGQSTGLRDKNGTLIFEGDLVQRRAPIYQLGSNEPTGEYTATGTVVVREDGNEAPNVCVATHDHLGNAVDIVLFVKTSGWHEGWFVIGNIWDDPEACIND